MHWSDPDDDPDDRDENGDDETETDEEINHSQSADDDAVIGQALADVTEKELLMEISAQLAEVRYFLASVATEREVELPEYATEDDPGAGKGMSTRICILCDQLVEYGDRRQHLTDAHNAPPDSDLRQFFEEVDE